MISVVVPTYKRPALLRRCIDALYHQDYAAGQYEILVVSDGPDPETKESLTQFFQINAPRLRYIPLEKKSGPAAARNAGWRSASGNLIVFTDDDCIPDRQWLKNFSNEFDKREGTDVALTGKTIVPISRNPTDYERNISHLADAEFITANCACSKNALLKTAGFDERFTMAWREDSDLQFKLIEHSIPFVKVPSAIVTHPVRKAPWGVSIKEEKKGIFNALLYKKFPHLYRKKIQPQPPWLYYCILIFFILFLMGWIFQSALITALGLISWGIVTITFIFKRLKSTSHSTLHISEMIVTSLVIPFLSLYWRWYGSFKFRTFLL
jgi:glycosyltransferase involved in cell wall biosynthesis